VAKIRRFTSGSSDPKHVPSTIDQCQFCQGGTYFTYPCATARALGVTS
jgi:hypothetical protein